MSTHQEEPNWLSAEEDAAFRTFMKATTAVDASLDRQLRRDAGLSHFDYTVLARLSETPERAMFMGELARTSSCSASRLSQVIGRMERYGWVKRRHSEHDARFTRATLTDAGFTKLSETAPGHVAQVRRVVFDSLTKAQIAQLVEISRRLSRAAEAATDA